MTGLRRDETRFTIYMMVLKACIGVGTQVMLMDGGGGGLIMRPVGEALRPGSKSHGLMLEGKGKCYLGERMARWCWYNTKQLDVCQAV